MQKTLLFGPMTDAWNFNELKFRKIENIGA